MDPVQVDDVLEVPAHQHINPGYSGDGDGHIREKRLRSFEEALTMADKLNTGDTFPRLSLNLADGGTLALPDDLEARYNVILFYRGHW